MCLTWVKRSECRQRVTVSSSCRALTRSWCLSDTVCLISSAHRANIFQRTIKILTSALVKDFWFNDKKSKCSKDPFAILLQEFFAVIALTSNQGFNFLFFLFSSKSEPGIANEKKKKFLGGSRACLSPPPPPPPRKILKVETKICAIWRILGANLKKCSTLKFLLIFSHEKYIFPRCSIFISARNLVSVTNSRLCSIVPTCSVRGVTKH